MKHFIIAAFLIGLIALTACSQSQDKKINSTKSTANHAGELSEDCEGCEVFNECPVPFNKLPSIDTLPGFNEAGPKLHISGTIFKHDGKTPAKDVVLFLYHTDQTGRYPNKGNTKGMLKRYGYIHSWIKTDNNGKYSFYTLRPASYPSGNNPAHIHAIIKEANGTKYWINDYLFDDDPLLTSSERSRQSRHGGSGIIKPVLNNGIWSATRNIILGLNVPGYIETAQQTNLQSGLDVGTPCPAFDPLHISGADAGTKACPMCKYGFGQGIMVWFNHANLDSMNTFAQLLENEVQKRGEKKLRVFLICMNPSYKKNDIMAQKISQRKIKEWCDKQNLSKVAVVWVPSPIDEGTCKIYNINPEVKNTVFVYKKRVVAGKWINLSYTDNAVESLLKYL